MEKNSLTVLNGFDDLARYHSHPTDMLLFSPSFQSCDGFLLRAVAPMSYINPPASYRPLNSDGVEYNHSLQFPLYRKNDVFWIDADPLMAIRKGIINRAVAIFIVSSNSPFSYFLLQDLMSSICSDRKDGKRDQDEPLLKSKLLTKLITPVPYPIARLASENGEVEWENIWEPPSSLLSDEHKRLFTPEELDAHETGLRDADGFISHPAPDKKTFEESNIDIIKTDRFGRVVAFGKRLNGGGFIVVPDTISPREIEVLLKNRPTDADLYESVLSSFLCDWRKVLSTPLLLRVDNITMEPASADIATIMESDSIRVLISIFSDKPECFAELTGIAGSTDKQVVVSGRNFFRFLILWHASTVGRGCVYKTSKGEMGAADRFKMEDADCNLSPMPGCRFFNRTSTKEAWPQYLKRIVAAAVFGKVKLKSAKLTDALNRICIVESMTRTESRLSINANVEVSPTIFEKLLTISDAENEITPDFFNRLKNFFIFKQPRA